jgi:hypothetical protein
MITDATADLSADPIVVDMGFPQSSAAGVLVWANVGGVAGGIALGQRIGMKPLTIGVMLLSTVMVMLFGRSPPDLQRLPLLPPWRWARSLLRTWSLW